MYTESDLSIVCPKCKAVKGGRCLDPVKDGSRYVDNPHQERVAAAAQLKDVA